MRVCSCSELLPEKTPEPRARPIASSSSIKIIARRRVAGLFEEIAHATRTHPDNHFHELAGAHAEKRHVGFTSHCPGEQGLAGARCADEEHAFGHHAAQPRVLRGVLEEIDDFDELGFRFFDASHVGEGHAALANGRLVVTFGLALAQAKDATTRLPGGFSGQPQEPTDQQYRRAKAKEDGDERVGGLIQRPCVDNASMRGQQRLETGVCKGRDHRREVGYGLGGYRRVRLICNGGFECSLDRIGARADLRDVVGLDLLLEKRVGDLDTLRLTGGDQLDKQNVGEQHRRKEQQSPPPSDWRPARRAG